MCGIFTPHMNKNLHKFGQILKELRISNDFSLREICRKVSYDPSNWSKIERGKFPPPSDRETLRIWAGALNLSKGSRQFEEFVDQATVAQGIIPSDVLKEQKILQSLPAFFRTLRNKKPSKEEIDKLIELIKNV